MNEQQFVRKLQHVWQQMTSACRAPALGSVSADECCVWKQATTLLRHVFLMTTPVLTNFDKPRFSDNKCVASVDLLGGCAQNGPTMQHVSSAYQDR